MRVLTVNSNVFYLRPSVEDAHKRLLEAAMNNVEKNNLSDRITLLLNSSNRKLPIDDVPEREYVHFFYM